jgi:16S rRNA (cytosine967-C5)-methyltransferase
VPMKLHRVLAEAIIESLGQIFKANRHADKVIEKVLKSNKKWGARDRAFIAESVYDIVRYWRKLCFVIDREHTNDKVLWEVFGVWFLMKHDAALPEWSEFKNISTIKIKERLAIAATNKAIDYAIPDWIYERGMIELGEQWDIELSALNTLAPVILRANTLKTDVKTLQQLLGKEGIETVLLSDTPDALQLSVRKNLFGTALFQDGFFEIQDAGSQWIAPSLDIAPGMRVVDACAGAGGKALHLAALMENKGQLIAMDIEEWKLTELKKRAKRAGAHNIETRWIENTKVIKRLHDSADRLLLDVPCSGLGVLKRNPDSKWKLKADFLEQIIGVQQHILENYSKMLRKDGKMVYATCSLLPSEDELQIKRFLEQQNGKFELLSERRCSPALHGYDGFYMATLKRVV